MSDLQDVPDCLEPLGGDRFRCRKFGWVIEVSQYPVLCACPAEVAPAAPPAQPERPPISDPQSTNPSPAADHWPLTTAAPRPGDCLHDLILRIFGTVPTDDCQCRSRISQMNAWGPAGCREHLEEITGWLLEEARQRGGPGARLFGAGWAVRLLVLAAIRRAEGSVSG